MAAGMGTRMQPFSDILPKALMPVFGAPILQYTLDLFRFDPMRTVVVNAHHKAKMIQEAIPKLDRGNLDVLFSDESDLLLGSAGGMVKALPFFDNKPFFRVNADRLIDLDFEALEQKHFELKNKYGVLMTLALATARSGAYPEILIDDQKERVKAVGKRVSKKPFFTGVAIMEPDAFKGMSADQPSDFVTSVLSPALEQNRVGCHLTEFDWIDIDSPEQLYHCHLELMSRYEASTLPKGWKFRMYEKNRRLAEEIWVSRAINAEEAPGWKKKVYYFGAKLPSGPLGPDIVSYGQPEGERDRSNGIRLKTEWLDMTAAKGN